MFDSPATVQYITSPTQYYEAQHVNHGPLHVVPSPPKSEAPQQRKRPKYTRSKTGCLTCRVKKIKVRCHLQVLPGLS